MIWVQITVTGSSHLYVAAFYRPPNIDSTDYLASLDNAISRIPPNAHVWLSGDFNLGDIDWAANCAKGPASKPRLCNQLLNIANDRFLQQVVTEPTRITETTSSTLDLFFTNNSTLVVNSEVIPSMSDHEAIYIEASLRPHKTPTQSRIVSLYKKADFETIREGLRKFYSEMPDPNIATTDELLSSFKDRSQSLITKHVPSKVCKGQKNHKPWINQKV